MSKMLSALKRLEEKAALAAGQTAAPAEPSANPTTAQSPVPSGADAVAVDPTPNAPSRVTAAPIAAPSLEIAPTIAQKAVAPKADWPPPPFIAATPAFYQPPTVAEPPAQAERRVTPTLPWPGATPVPPVPGRGLDEVPSLAIPFAPATLPMPGVKAVPREPMPARRATDRYVVAPHYSAICDRILARVPPTRAAALWLVPATIDTDASTVVAELALSLAQITNDTVLALDCDGPRSASGNFEDASDSALGVADILGEKLDWQKAVSPTRDRRVQLVPTGRRATLSGLTTTNAVRLAPLVTEMKTRYRFVLIHGGATSVQSSVAGNATSRQQTGVLAQAISRVADIAYLVMPLHQTSRRDARAAKRRIEQLGGVVHGTILTGTPPEDTAPATDRVAR